MIRVKIANPYEFELDFQQIKSAAKTVLEGERITAADLVIAFVDNAHIHRLNKQFLDHDEPTDVLTFPYSEPKSRKLEGEIVIGYEVAKEQAAERGHDWNVELALYAIHGCLHLCGYDDQDARSAQTMRAQERHYLQECGLPDVADPSANE